MPIFPRARHLAALLSAGFMLWAGACGGGTVSTQTNPGSGETAADKTIIDELPAFPDAGDPAEGCVPQACDDACKLTGKPGGACRPEGCRCDGDTSGTGEGTEGLGGTGEPEGAEGAAVEGTEGLGGEGTEGSNTGPGNDGGTGEGTEGFEGPEGLEGLEGIEGAEGTGATDGGTTGGNDGGVPDCPNPTNGCGGCDPLPGNPGTPCGACGEWVCDGPNSAVCAEGTPKTCIDYTACQTLEACVCPTAPFELCDGKDNDCDPATVEEGKRLDCPPGQSCRQGKCIAGCVPECSGRECGDDGCGRPCGSCLPGFSCGTEGVCHPGNLTDCVPGCPKGKLCDKNKPVPTCVDGCLTDADCPPFTAQERRLCRDISGGATVKQCVQCAAGGDCPTPQTCDPSSFTCSGSGPCSPPCGPSDVCSQGQCIPRSQSRCGEFCSSSADCAPDTIICGAISHVCVCL